MRGRPRASCSFCTALEVALSTGPASKGNESAAAAACLWRRAASSRRRNATTWLAGIIWGED